MNDKGEVRSASEFKQIHEDTGDSYRPYCCPFCEVPYEDCCIETECVRAPYFRVAHGKTHRGGCTGEALDAQGREVAPPKAPKKEVVGDVGLPEALVIRRPSTRVRKPGDDGTGPPPDQFEVIRRRKAVGASGGTIPSLHTTSHLRPIVQAYRRLREAASAHARSKKFEPKTPEFNAAYRAVLDSKKLALYDQKLTYGNAFQNSRLSPGHYQRIYSGRGAVAVVAHELVLSDVDLWPKVPKAKDDLVPFEVRIDRVPSPGSPTSHRHALQQLEDLAVRNATIEWWALGVPVLSDGRFVLTVTSIDHLFWPRQNQP